MSSQLDKQSGSTTAVTVNHTLVHGSLGAFFALWLFLIVQVYRQTESAPIQPTRDHVHPLKGLPTSLQRQRQGQELSPITVEEVTEYLSGWVSQLHEHLSRYKEEKAEGIWAAFHNLTSRTLYPWDQKYLQRMPERRQDGSIFLSVASYRDENCFNTLVEAYKQAKYADKLFVGLVQQNCNKDCRTGIMDDGKSKPQEHPDPDCHDQFCHSDIGLPHCKAGRVRTLHIEEPESLGPYMARYFASKLWSGEEWYMQVDAHMTFAEHWDDISLQGLQKAPSPKPVISHYPPGHTSDLRKFENSPSSRICGPIFTAETIRLEGSGLYDHVKLDTPRFAPVMGAGYFVAHSSFLKEVPFDPFLPWIFMGEEIIISSRLWTSGYDIFSPAQAVVGHIYFRRHQPKFWESVHRAFTPGVHNPLEQLVLDRVQYQLGFPEASKDMLAKSILTGVDHYTMGTERSLQQYMEMIGMNVTTKECTRMAWCEEGKPPPLEQFEKYAHLYET